MSLTYRKENRLDGDVSRQCKHFAMLSKKVRLFWATALPIMAAFCAIYSAAFITAQANFFPQAPLLACSMGASAIILFLLPGSAFASSRSFVGGHIISALVGTACAIGVTDTALAAALAVCGSMLVMQLLRCINPPGAATALAPVMSPIHISLIGHVYFLASLAINILVMLLFALVFNRILISKTSCLTRSQAPAGECRIVVKPVHNPSINRG